MLNLLCLLLSLTVFAEEKAPAAEYPYPERAVASDSLGVEAPVKKGKRGEYYYDTKTEKKKKSYKGVEQPYKVGPDGSYYYKTDSDDKKDKNYKGVEQPVDTDSDGGYYYSTDQKKSSSKVKYGPKPSRVNSDGSYMYNAELKDETENTLFLRLGMASPPSIQADNGSSFDDVYGTDSNFILTLEYDWALSKDLFIKVGSGITSTQGNGQFASGSLSIDPRETFQFFVFPNTVTFSYKFQVWNSQMVTPYIEAGPGYFTFIENRSDGNIFSFNGKTTKYGGAFVATASLGFLISVSSWSPGTDLVTDYGASQSWVDVQFKQVFGLDQRKDFTSNIITAGIAIGF